MNIYKDVRGTMDKVPNIEVGVDTVYIRSNIVEIDEEDFKGWEYDEIQYKKDNYIEFISNKNELLESSLLELTMNQAVKEAEVESLILELTMLIGGI